MDGSGMYICAQVFDHYICVWSNCRRQIKVLALGLDEKFRDCFHLFLDGFDVISECQWLASLWNESVRRQLEHGMDYDEFHNWRESMKDQAIETGVWSGLHLLV
jgi:hypothetical protein